MGPLDEAGKAASGTIDALKSQPLVLALVVLQAFVLAAVLYNSVHRQAGTDKQFAQLFALLQACLPQQRGELELPLPRPRPESLQ